MPIQKSKISYTVDLEEELNELDVAPGKRKKATLEAGREALRQIKEYTSNTNSPVKNQGTYKALSEKYADFKKKDGQPPVPNLRLNFDMLNSMKVESTKKGFTIKITDSKEKKKAFNHNTPKDKINKLPKRQFIPDDTKKQKFKKPIEKQYLRKLKDYARKAKG